MMKDFSIDNIRLPDLEIIKRAETMQSVLDDFADIEITPISEVIEEQLKPIIEKEEKTIEILTDNYNKLNELYKIKEKELENAKKDNEVMKKDNRAMKKVSIISAVIAFLSFIATVATILVGVFI